MFDSFACPLLDQAHTRIRFYLNQQLTHVLFLFIFLFLKGFPFAAASAAGIGAGAYPVLQNQFG